MHAHNTADDVFVVIRFVMTGNGTLEQSVIALSVNKFAFIKLDTLKTLIYVRGENEIIFSVYDVAKFFVNGLRRLGISIKKNISHQYAQYSSSVLYG